MDINLHLSTGLKQLWYVHIMKYRAIIKKSNRFVFEGFFSNEAASLQDL